MEVSADSALPVPPGRAERQPHGNWYMPRCGPRVNARLKILHHGGPRKLLSRDPHHLSSHLPTGQAGLLPQLHSLQFAVGIECEAELPLGERIMSQACNNGLTSSHSISQEVAHIPREVFRILDHPALYRCLQSRRIGKSAGRKEAVEKSQSVQEGRGVSSLQSYRFTLHVSRLTLE